MDTTKQAKERANQAGAVVERYLEEFLATGEQDPAVRGLIAARWYGERTREVPGAQLIGPDADEYIAGQVIAELFGDILHFGEHWKLGHTELFGRTWELRGGFERFEPSVAALTDASEDSAYEVLSRLLADLLLCAERLDLGSQELVNEGHSRFINGTGEE
ncbi:hypothetical protein [Streptomyces sp. NEAU-174]|uniref:hypothetical protein n=1 Tax=Streptomyces sp. NEAU-174 TaxID=3458254 RepID=UPI00404496A7